MNEAPTVDAVARPSAARPSPQSPSARHLSAREHHEWYGSQILASDAAALAAMAVAAWAIEKDATEVAQAFATGSLGLFVAGGPAIHIAHDNWGRSLGSFALRVGTPLIGIAAGQGLDHCARSAEADDPCLTGVFVGGVIGMATAIAIDSALLAHETVRDQPVVMPVLSTGKNGTWLGVSGRF